jgi:transcriptional regulator with XRE-family HTH domain
MHAGHIIRMLREAEGMSQLDLAARLRVARTYLSQVENAKRDPSIALLKNAAAIFKIPVVLLLIEGPPEHRNVLVQLQQVLSHVLEAKRKISKNQKSAIEAAPSP